MRLYDLGRFARTVRHLRPAQIGHRVRLRGQQYLLRRWPAPFSRRWHYRRKPVGLPAGFVAIDALAPPACGPLEDLDQGRFTFLGETRELGASVAWDPAGASQLWLYHHHYWEWAWTLLAHPDRDRAQAIFERQFSSWMDSTTFGRWNAWAPYPTSLRSWALVNVAGSLAAGSSVAAALEDCLRNHVGFVEHNLELDVGGNHLIKNIKALCGLGTYFGDQRLVERAASLLQRELDRQVLPDGGHFELSPSYHCQVLGDLIDIDRLSAASGHPAPSQLGPAIAAMRTWLGTMLMPDGDVPVFNDSERLGRARLDALAPGPTPTEAITVLRDSGYVVARGSRFHLIADIGHPCPPELPAHAQADCLSFELALDGRRLVVDPGTSEYGSGPQRQWERSTAAHSTVAIDGLDQTEVWGSFRAGRRAEAVIDLARAEGDAVVIEGHHMGYAHLPGRPMHHRRWVVGQDTVEITDRVEGVGTHHLRDRLLLDSSQVARGPGGSVVLPDCTVIFSGPAGSEVHVSNAEFAVSHGRLRPGVAIHLDWAGELPATVTATIESTVAPNG